jgi:hypothetical protein
MRWTMVALTIGLLVATAAMAQEPAADEKADDFMRPTRAGVRMTPGLARAITRQMVKNGVLTREFGLEESRQEEAAEKIARRMMEMAHKNGRQGAEFFEFAMQSMIENNGRFTPESGKRWAELSKPLVPAFRDMATGIAEDMREMLPPNKQPAFAAKMLALSVAIDAYEKRMDRWLEGGAKEGENPFDDRSNRQQAETPADPNEPPALRESRQRSEREIERQSKGSWRSYVDRAAEYYQFTDAQKQTAESILREMEGRAKQMMNDEWRAKVMANRTRRNLPDFGASWNTPWAWRLEREFESLMAPLRDMTRELQDRLDEIPTTEQRQAADQRMAAKLAEKGLKE